MQETLSLIEKLGVPVAVLAGFGIGVWKVVWHFIKDLPKDIKEYLNTDIAIKQKLSDSIDESNKTTQLVQTQLVQMQKRVDNIDSTVKMLVSERDSVANFQSKRR